MTATRIGVLPPGANGQIPLEPDHENEAVGEDRIDEALDAALELTFPASDPVALIVPALTDVLPRA
jgi:hypothetical protein